MFLKVLYYLAASSVSFPYIWLLYYDIHVQIIIFMMKVARACQGMFIPQDTEFLSVTDLIQGIFQNSSISEKR